MAKDLYRSGNYVIAVDAEGYQREFPCGKTVYSERDGNLIIKEGQIEGQEITIKTGDAENWTNESEVAYTEATMRTFLRDNTGFNSALGGSRAEVGDILVFDGVRYTPEPQTPSTSLATDDQTINEPTRKIYLFDNGVSNIQLLNNSGSLVSQQDGYGKTDHVLHNTGRLGTAVQYSHSVYSRAASSSGVSKYHNYLNQNIIDVRQSVGKPSIGMYKYTPSQTEVVYLDGTNGRIRVLDRYEAQGLAGITKTTLNPTSITVTGGLITAMN